ncbi:uncharacterized protein LOC133186629 [Saccostrea echinata]|uniref:uncharacterized protein LOC133186629 n=1 Tax=Saccostrea echinata TaxID=191078 RepID=UPI002A7F9F34|nr:uncharacterized protein LOC133186629 [Saccostrea echinata]
MAEGDISQKYTNWNTTDFNLSDSSVYSSKNVDNSNAIVPEAQPVSPSAIDFSQRNTSTTKSYNPGYSFDPNRLRKREESKSLGNGSIGFNKDREEISFSSSYAPSQGTNITTLTSKDDEEDKKPNMAKKRVMETVKLVVVLICMAMGITAAVVLATQYGDPPPETQRQVQPKKFDCVLNSSGMAKTGRLKFNSSIVITCDYEENMNIVNSSIIMEFTPKYYFVPSQDKIEINSTLQSIPFRDGRWEIQFSTKKSNSIEFRRDPVKCGGDGKYELTLITSEDSFPSHVDIEIDSKTSAVQLKVGQTEDDGNYKITCSSTSDCTPMPITLLGTMGNKVGPLYGVNFTCIVKYNEYDGWSVSCTGSIPKDVVSSINEVTCRPVLLNEAEANTTEAKVPKDVLLCQNDEDCTFKCPQKNEDRYYTDPKYCNIFHRCVGERLYTAPCGKGTYFSSETCVCSHISDVTDCNVDGNRVKQLGDKKVLCEDSSSG